MWIEILKFAGFGFFWFAMFFIAILLSTGHDSTKKTELMNQIIFVGGPLLILLGYKIYTITKNDLNWSSELLMFFLITIVPLILAKLYITFGKAF